MKLGIIECSIMCILGHIRITWEWSCSFILFSRVLWNSLTPSLVFSQFTYGWFDNFLLPIWIDNLLLCSCYSCSISTSIILSNSVPFCVPYHIFLIKVQDSELKFHFHNRISVGFFHQGWLIVLRWTNMLLILF